MVRKKKKRPSMQDVAELAGVSRTTVSFVLNNKPGVNIPASTRTRVKAAIEKLNYRPNSLAQNLRSQNTRTIGFVSDVVATTPYAGQIIQGAQDLAWEHSNLLLLVNTGADKEMKRVAVETLLERQVDGILYATMYHREIFPPDALREVPTVLLDCFIGDRSLPSVVPDEVQAGFDATTYLIEKGHKKIGYITHKLNVPAKIGRLQGYKNALLEKGIPFDSNLIRETDSEELGAVELTKDLLKQEKPTAIFCFNDRMAMGVYQALRELKLSIPNDIAVFGFDDQQLIAAEAFPPLTTMALPHYEMGQWAVDHLLKLINSKQEELAQSPPQHLETCRIIARDSA